MIFENEFSLLIRARFSLLYRLMAFTIFFVLPFLWTWRNKEAGLLKTAEDYKQSRDACGKRVMMKRSFKKMTVLAAAAALTMAQAAPASAAYYWRQDARGWWLEDENGSYLTNQWYQSPSNGLWYYMGADGYMLTNTVTPDGFTVDGEGVWRGAAGAEQTTAGRDTAAIQSTAEAYKVFEKSRSEFAGRFSPDSYVFVDIDSDGIPECIPTNGTKKEIFTFRSGKVTYFYQIQVTEDLLYVSNGNILCLYYHPSNSSKETRYFYEIKDNGSFNQIGRSSFDGSTYSTANRSNTTKAIYDDYNNSFGTFTKISLDYDDTYRSIDAALAAYLGQ